MDLKELYRLLDQNETLLWAELNCPKKRRSTDMKRLLELQLHRFEIYKSIIDRLEMIMSKTETRKVA